MKPTILGVILDSSVVIEAERQHLNVAAFLKQIDKTIGERDPPRRSPPHRPRPALHL